MMSEWMFLSTPEDEYFYESDEGDEDEPESEYEPYDEDQYEYELYHIDHYTSSDADDDGTLPQSVGTDDLSRPVSSHPTTASTKVATPKLPHCVTLTKAQPDRYRHEKCMICHDEFGTADTTATTSDATETFCNAPVMYTTNKCTCSILAGEACVSTWFETSRRCLICRERLFAPRNRLPFHNPYDGEMARENPRNNAGDVNSAIAMLAATSRMYDAARARLLDSLDEMAERRVVERVEEQPVMRVAVANITEELEEEPLT